MIVGVIIRNFKTYKGLNYLPISNGANYCGLIGLNGVGKSSILEALDCYFNNKDWNRNIDAVKTEMSYVIPIIVLKKGFFKSTEQEEYAEKYSDVIKAFLSKDISTTIQSQRKVIWDAIKAHYESLPIGEDLFLPIGININGNVEVGICSDVFDSIQEIKKPDDFVGDYFSSDQYKELRETRNKGILDNLSKLLCSIKDELTYIYIPKDIEPERFVKFETEEIQHLIGSNLVDEVKAQLSKKDIDIISKGLREFIDELSNSLPNYKFKAKSERQPNLKSKDIYDLIVHDFFSKRELCKINNGKDVPLELLSSGEKQQAITTLIHGSVMNYRKNNDSLIIAIDEPESALHVSKCFEQFQKLYEISEKCNQVLFSSHWYGFIPAIPTGCVANIVKKDDKHIITIFDIFKYREEIKHGISDNKGNFPIDITLKGINDLVQSIISSVINSEINYNWLVCEGSSDRLYLEAYLKEEVKDLELKIVPVSGLGDANKIYQQLTLAFEDLKSDIKGKVFILGDTDEDLKQYQTKDIKNLKFKRIVNDKVSEKTLLVDMDSIKTGKTDIEDALNGKVFNIVLNRFKDENDELSFVNDEEMEEKASYYAMDLKQSDYTKLDNFFSKEKNRNKVLFAIEYVKELSKGNYQIPSWIEEIKAFFKQ